MLNKRLIARTRPMARKKNTVVFGDTRITVLGDSLFRVEKDAKKRFCDEATQIVWFRDLPEVPFEKEEKDGFLLIRTGRVTLGVGRRLSDCFVEIGGEKKPLSNRGNLLGTYRTLDRYNGDRFDADGHRMKLENGVVSETGVAILDDSKSLILTKEGTIVPRDHAEKDLYVFAFGKRYREAVAALYGITGPVPMIPRFALGNWWSRYHAYSDKEYLHLLDNLEKENVPVTVGIIDMDWHWSMTLNEKKKLTESGKDDDFHGGKSGWTGYSWNTDLFPDWKDTVKKIHEKNLKVSLNLHPASGVRFFEDMYADVARAVGIDPTTEEKIPFDMTNEKFVNAYFDHILNPYEKDGIDFWWIDWQQGQKTAIPGLDPLWLLNHYQFLDMQGKECPLILSRYSGIGSHRYPLGFSGDTYITWDTLKYQPYFTKTASNAGYPWWSHDIGGHMRGYKDDELFVRLLQLGVFSPINRLHCSCEDVLTKEPAVFMNGTGYLASEFLRFRHRLIPYLWSAGWETSHNGLALVEPLYYECPDVPDAYTLKDEYLFGRELLVSAVTAKGMGKDRLAEVTMYLPEGHWTDIFTGDEYEGGETKKLYRWLDSLPVLARAGAFVPMDHRTAGNASDVPTHLDVLTFSGDGQYTLHEAKGKKECATVFTAKAEKGRQTVSFTADGLACRERTFTFVFRNIPTGTAHVTADGKPIAFRWDDNGCLTVTVEKIAAGVRYEIAVDYAIAADEIKDRQILYTLMRLTGSNPEKQALWNRLRENHDPEAREARILRADFLTAQGRKRLLEVLHG